MSIEMLSASDKRKSKLGYAVALLHLAKEKSIDLYFVSTIWGWKQLIATVKLCTRLLL